MTVRDPIEYLLNAMELAAAADKPAEHGYGQKRKAVLDAICELRQRADRAAPEGAQESERADRGQVKRLLEQLCEAYYDDARVDDQIDELLAVFDRAATPSGIVRDACPTCGSTNTEWHNDSSAGMPCKTLFCRDCE